MATLPKPRHATTQKQRPTENLRRKEPRKDNLLSPATSARREFAEIEDKSFTTQPEISARTPITKVSEQMPQESVTPVS